MLEQNGASPQAPAKGNLVFLTQRIPYPPIKGEKIRPLQILKHFTKSYNVYLGCLIDDPQDQQHANTVRALCTDAYFGTLNRRWDNLSHLKAMASGRALSVALYDHRGLAQWTSRMLATLKPDVVFVCSSNMAPYVLDQPFRGRTCIVDLADVDSEKWRAYAEKASGIMKWVYQREAGIVFDLERRIARETDYSTLVSEPEARLFRALVPERARAIVGVPSGIEHTYFDPQGDYPAPYDASMPTFVFTGTMDYVPNVDAVTWFAQDILPIIRRTLPTAQFYIVGSSPAPAVQRLDKIDGVHVTGRVPDVRPYIAHATAVVAPMRIARGIQNKVMEAMAMAKPVIVTSDALEGIDAVVGEELILADTVESFAGEACRLAADRDLGHRIGAAARRRMVGHFSWEAQLGGFDRLIAASR
jgi:sugar transferase (PEP-CTERM/EpsH1 system associated)